MEVYRNTVGDEKFNGMVFVKFTPMEKREHAMSIFNKAGMIDLVSHMDSDPPPATNCEELPDRSQEAFRERELGIPEVLQSVR